MGESLKVRVMLMMGILLIVGVIFLFGCAKKARKEVTAKDILAKVEKNFSLMKDLKVDVFTIGKVDLEEVGERTILIFKKPNMSKMILQEPNLPPLGVITKGRKTYVRNPKTGEVESDLLPWEYLLEPTVFAFYNMLTGEFLDKFDVSIKEHPSEEIYILEAITKKRVPEDLYDIANCRLKMTVDYKRGVIPKIMIYNLAQRGRHSATVESGDFVLLNNKVWFPTEFGKVVYPDPKEGVPEIRIEKTLSNVHINSGILAAEFNL